MKANINIFCDSFRLSIERPRASWRDIDYEIDCLRFVMTGSDDTNLRIWKANASQKLGAMVPREARKQQYRNSLKKRYCHLCTTSSSLYIKYVADVFLASPVFLRISSSSMAFKVKTQLGRRTRRVIRYTGKNHPLTEFLFLDPSFSSINHCEEPVYTIIPSTVPYTIIFYGLLTMYDICTKMYLLDCDRTV